MDSDAMRTRGAFRDALAEFRDGRAQILVGTKMIAKGFHFPNVTLVGVINADTAFNLPDFRSAETTYQELTHVTGRPGRGEHPGRVIVQTYHPTHFSVTCAAAHDAAKFYELELEARRGMGYPPFEALIRLLFEGRDEEMTRKAARQFTGALAATIIGPSPAPVYRIRNRFRYHALAKSPDGAALRRAVAELLDKRALRGTVDLTVDVDPYDAM
jgi:primosomal protein N' (replication factor Y)